MELVQECSQKLMETARMREDKEREKDDKHKLVNIRRTKV